MNRKNQQIAFGIITLVLCVLLFLQRLTGGIWHAVLGIALIILMIVHLCRENAKLKYRKAAVRIIDWALIVLLAVLFISGILLHPLQDVLALKIIHKLSAVLFVLGILAHMVQHLKTKKR